MNIFTERLRALPKAELHVHLEGTVTAGLLSLLAERNGVELTTPVIFPNSPPIYPPGGTASGKPILNSFLDFIGLYVKISQCIQETADVVLVCEEYAKQAQAENIVQAEIYFSPTTFQALGKDLDLLSHGLKEGGELAWTRYGVRFIWIFDIVRNASENGEEIIDIALHAKKMGVTVGAIGLAGYEAVAPAARFEKAFEKARQLGFQTLAHAGETAGPESIEETVRLLKPSRIGHGITILQNPRVVELLRQLQTPIEVCPWSNICLKLTGRNDHPLKQMLDAGLNIVLGADDPGIFQKTLTDNFILANELGVPLEQLSELAEKSLAYRLCPT